MVHVLTKTFNTSTCIYYSRSEERGRFFPKNFKKIKIHPTIVSVRHKMSSWSPKMSLDGIYNIKKYFKMNAGEHFVVLEKPKILINNIVKFFKTLR